jgi:hypothetical protein
MQTDLGDNLHADRGQRRELRSIQWFATPAGASAAEGAGAVIVRTGIGVAAGLLVLLGLGHVLAGSIIVLISVALGTASLVSPAARSRVSSSFARLGDWLGVAVSWILLTPVFLVGFSVVRGWMWLTRSDPLQLGKSTRSSHWLDADEHERKLRYASAMFASERVTARGLSLPAALGLGVVALLLSEALLRLWGFGAPVLYVSDPQAGFYPAPNQVVDRYAGRIETNQYGMRSPIRSREKPAGTFRVLMVGDSTLYGGSYVDQEDLYSRQLESQLKHAAGGRPVEVLAIGVNSWGPFHEIGYIEKFGTFGADLVLVQLPTIDIYRPYHGIGEVPFYRVDNPPRFAIEELLGHLAWRIRARISGPSSATERDWNGRRGLEAYRRLAQLVGGNGAEVVFNVLPSKPAGLGGRAPDEEMRDLRRLRDAVAPLTVNYPAGLFRGAVGNIYHDEGHLDVAGHRLYAIHLRDSILRSSQAWARWTGGSASIEATTAAR